MRLLEVAVTLPLHKTFTYRDPRAERAALGTQVVVPFGSRTVTGFVVGYPTEAPGELRDIEDVVGDEPAVAEDVLDLCQWAAAYYLAPLGELLRAAVPKGERAEAASRIRTTPRARRLLKREAAGEYRFESFALDAADRALLARVRKASSLRVLPLVRADVGAKARIERLEAAGLLEVGDEVRGKGRGGKPPEVADTGAPRDTPPALNQDQAQAFERLVGALGQGHRTFVLHGITGSGKTEVYLRLIAEVRRRQRGALVLVPEIALTPQLAARFRGRFGDDVEVLHSALPPGRRRAAWRRLRRGEVGIALGARSAVFAPVRALGVVVVDEEHDGSFKQEDGVRYQGRDLAVVRAQKAEAVAVLGSATPALETFHNVLRGKFERLLLRARASPAAAARALPPVEVVDLRIHPPGPEGLFSPALAGAIEKTLAAGEQTILFLNRRGFSTFMLCRGCGQSLSCRECSVSLTFHRARGRLVCHYCGHAESMPQVCPACRRPTLQGMGSGTERVEELIRQAFPTARVARLDRDTAAATRGAGGVAGGVERLLRRVHEGEIDILVGTQMVAKGHDFGGVTLVGVVQPDQGMHLPDFRAAERTFQVLEQVAGRAGRGDRAGRVIVQTYNPKHPAIECLQRHDYEGFAKAELAARRAAQYAPFSRMIALRVDGPEAKAVCAAAGDAAARARDAGGAGVRVLGPAEAPIKRLRGRARWQVWLASADSAALRRAARAGAAAALPKSVRLAVDVDPQSVL